MANEEMIQKHLDNFLAKIAGETPVDDTIQNSTEFWINKIAEQGGGGSEVIANPTLAGTEDDLTAIEIDGTKYKVPKGAYIATNSDATHITQESYNYIVANWNTRPCYYVYEGVLYNVVQLDGDRLVSDIVLGYITNNLYVFYRAIVRDSLRYERDEIGVPFISANPSAIATSTLTKIQIANAIYKVCDGVTNGLGYLTTAPTSANNDGIKIVVLSSEPATKYNGYLYIILA